MLKSRLKRTKILLLFWTLFIGIGALAGSLSMLIDPTGKILQMESMLPYFQVLPFSSILFQDYTFSGIMLLIVNGITNLIAFTLIIINKKSGIVLGFIFGITLMLWITIQFIIFPFNFLSTAYFIFGLLQTITGYICLVSYKQEHFYFNESDYQNIGSNDKIAVVYFSRMGYVKKKAYEIANASGATIVEIKSLEKVNGIGGFWWCGRFKLFNKEMKIESISIDLSKYNHVTICTPIWAFGLASPVKTFCKLMKNKIKEADYVLIHYSNLKYQNVVKEMDSLLSITHTNYQSISCKVGKYKVIKK